MAKQSKQFTCQSCSAQSTQWAGRCDACGEWNTIVEDAGVKSGIGAHPAAKALRGRAVNLVGLDGEDAPITRLKSKIGEFDRVTGGGLVPGSAVLVGGDPGIGKSTLLLQAAAALARLGERVVYISGEEAIAQVRLRAERLGLKDAPVELAVETNLADILATLEQGKPPALLVVDSIQTTWSPQLDAAPGTVSQVRACAQQLIRYAKSNNTAVFLIGHVTKDGQIAGPRVVEHMVDTVLYFEGERGHQFRILRAVKNRFGPTDEIGVFEMGDKGLSEVANPSSLFLSGRESGTPGAAVFAGIEGTRPVLVEIQALVATSNLGTPRRAVVGWDQSRLAMVLAVLDAHCGLSLSNHDVYLNVAGGLKIKEPAADLAVAAALISSLSGAVLDPQSVIFGEISLSGALRPVAQADSRLKEAAKLGFKAALLPSSLTDKRTAKSANLSLSGLESVAALVAHVAALAPKKLETVSEPVSQAG